MTTPNGSGAITVAPRSTLVLPIQLSIPANASPGDHTGGISVGLLTISKNKKNEPVTFEQRVVTKVLVRVSGTVHAALTVTDLQASYEGTLNPVGRGNVVVRYTVHNNGNVNLGGHQKVTVSGIFGASGPKPALADVPVLLPGSSDSISVRLTGVLPQVLLHGTVRVVPIAQPGAVDPGLHEFTATTTFWAIPWMLLLIVVVLVALTLALRWWRRRRNQPGRHGASTTRVPVLTGGEATS
jgi:hypothetical protein